ncbi:MAG TPA: MraY family glycosyltransferase [Candidatus Staskawiczbacteria bacterium]|nr:MraY family glycosyltransferase [Candidatus Staskawiczbacteria bacterium]
MQTNLNSAYILFFIIALILSVIFVLLAKKISVKYKFYDDPGKDSLKIHKAPVSFLGGGAMLASFLICLGLIWIFKKYFNFEFNNLKLAALFVCGIIAWFYGFWDDTYWAERTKIKQGAKILIQVPIAFALALIFYIVQIKYQFFDVPILGIFIAAMAFLFMQNAVNLHDGIDGLAGSTSFISAVAFFIFFVFCNNILAALVSAIIAGSILGFLIFNFKSATIFMGNNGSYFLGFVMVAMALMAAWPNRIFYSAFPYLLLSAPILNVVYVFTKRALKKKSFFEADRSHIHDDILKVAKSPQKVVFCVGAVHIIFAALGLILLVLE